MELFRVKLQSKNHAKVDVTLNSDLDRFQVVVYEIKSGSSMLGRYRNLGPALTKFYSQIGKLCLGEWSVEKVISKEITERR